MACNAGACANGMFPSAPSSFGSQYGTGTSQNYGYGNNNNNNNLGYNSGGYNFFGGNAGGDVMDSRDNSNVWSQFFGLG